MTEACLAVFMSTFSEEHCMRVNQGRGRWGWRRAFCNGLSWTGAQSFQLSNSDRFGSHLQTLTACGHGITSTAIPPSILSGFVAGMWLDLCSQMCWVCCAVSGLSVHECYGAHNQTEKDKASLTAEEAAGENKSTCPLTHKEPVEHLLKHGYGCAKQWWNE